MLGLTQNQPLNLISILHHAARWHGRQEIVTRKVEDGRLHRQTYKTTYERTGQLAHALDKLGVKGGDRVGTLAWNTHRHIEVWYATAGTAAICHTVNPRLFPEQIEYIINHAEDRFLFLDIDLIPIIEPLLDKLQTIEAFILLTDRANMPDCSDKPGRWLCYEELLTPHPSTFDWVQLENDAAASSLCYTSGTTGNPKGVLYSHRANFYHTLISIQKDCLNLGSADNVLMVVPMFHANSWGIAFSAPMTGAKLVLPGRQLDGESVYDLLETEEVTFSAGVPTVWKMVLDYVKEADKSFSTLHEVLIGGSTVPKSMIEAFKKGHDVNVVHAWGMTEMSPLGTINRPLASARPLETDSDNIIDQLANHGRVPFGVDIKIVNDEGNTLANDGITVGKLLSRGPCVVERYYKHETTELKDGWFETGDVATIDENGFMTIADRAKDVIKSGGEWISSVDIENAAVAHEDVALAACIGVRDDQWGERPILLVELAENATFNEQSIRDKIAPQLQKWQMPDRVIQVDKIPLTATGKVDKKPLKEKFK